jgi:hypothetical protein
MSNIHEQDRPEATDYIEQSRKTVEGFIAYTKTLLSGESHTIDVEWEHQMNILYGNEELLRVTKNKEYKGIPGIKDELESAYESGGLPQLKITFIRKAVENTQVSKLGDASLNAFKRIIDSE